MGSLAVHQLLQKAQGKGVDLDLETAQLENQRLLEAVEKMSMDSMPKTVKRAIALVSSACCFIFCCFDFQVPN